MCGAVRQHLHPLSFSSSAVSNPNTLAVAITVMRVACIRVRLLDGTVAIEDIQMGGKRRVGIFETQELPLILRLLAR